MISPPPSDPPLSRDPAGTARALAGAGEGPTEAYVLTRSTATLAFEPEAASGVLTVGEQTHLALRRWGPGGPVLEVGELREPLPGPASPPALQGERSFGAQPRPPDAQALRGAAQRLVWPRGVRVQALLLEDEARHWAVASSEGGSVVAGSGTCRLWVRAETPLGAVVESQRADCAEQLDLEAVTRRLELAQQVATAPRSPPTSGLKVALGPHVAAPLIAALGTLLRGDVAASSPGLARAVGKALFPRAFSLEDVVEGPGFDEEGMARASCSLIKEGRLCTFLHTAQTAQALGAAGNGRASRALPGLRPLPSPAGLRVLGGGEPLPADCLELSVRLETFTTMPRAGQVTLIAAGFERRGNERWRAVGPLGLTLPLLPTLRRLLGVALEPELLAAEEVVTPWLIFDALPVVQEHL